MITFAGPELVENKNDSTCRICSKVFYNKQTMDRHYKDVHLMLKNFKCPYCYKRFAQKTDLKRHINTMHINTMHINTMHGIQEHSYWYFKYSTKMTSNSI